MIDKPRVRFAPSPTGELHVGNARTALFNWMFARHHGGAFVLRIEDTDESRSAESYQINLLNDLIWLGLDWDEGPHKDGSCGPYKQSERLNIYAGYLKKLIAADLVYPCYCTEEELEEERQTLILSKRMPRYMGRCRNLSPMERRHKEEEGRNPSYRFKVPDMTVEFNDLIRGPMKFEGKAMGDFIIVRSNGMPAYNFAVVIDDHLMGITHVIRGEDHLSNTALQVMLYKAFGFPPPDFAHHSLILGKDRAKLSKRHGSVSVGEFRRHGILPEALVNYLGLLGSSFAEGREILSRDEMIAGFDLTRASKSGAIFDEEKLRWLNAVYIRNASTDDLLERSKHFMEQAGYKPDRVDPVWFRKVVDLIKNDLTTFSEIGDHISIFFDDTYTISAEARNILEQENAGKVVQAFAEYLLTDKDSYGEAVYPAAIKYAREKAGAKGKELYLPIRAALTGRLHGPELDRIFALLERDTVLKRLANAAAS